MWHLGFPEHVGLGTFIPRGTQNFPGSKGVIDSLGDAVAICLVRKERAAADTSQGQVHSPPYLLKAGYPVGRWAGPLLSVPSCHPPWHPFPPEEHLQRDMGVRGRCLLDFALSASLV